MRQSHTSYQVAQRFVCACCARRITVGSPLGEPPSLLDPTTLDSVPGWRALERFAAEFDRLAEEAGESGGAMDFISWLAPSVKGHPRHRATQSITSLQPVFGNRERVVA